MVFSQIKNTTSWEACGLIQIFASKFLPGLNGCTTRHKLSGSCPQALARVAPDWRATRGRREGMTKRAWAKRGGGCVRRAEKGLGGKAEKGLGGKAEKGLGGKGDSKL